MKVLVGIIIGIAAVILLLSNAYCEDKGISPSDFQIISFNLRWEDGRLRVIGEIKNNGKIPAGPEVEVIARDANGVLIESQKFWPNSTNNIPPGGTSGISYTITRDARAKSGDIKVISVHIWK